VQRGSVLTASDAAASDAFGRSVALNANATFLAIGAPLWEGSLTDQGGVYSYAAPVEYTNIDGPTWPLSVQLMHLIDGASWPISLQVADSLALQSTSHGFGYAAQISGVDITSRLIGQMTIEAEENMAALATWRMMPPSGAVDPSGYVGQPAELFYVWRDNAGQNTQTLPIWKGIIDAVEIDPSTFELKFTGLDRREELLAAAPALPGGLWSVGVFDAGDDALQQQIDRLTTLCASFDLLPDGSPILIDWAAKTTSDFNFEASDYVWGSLSLTLASHADLVQRVTATFDYRFSRLRLRERRIGYDFGGATQLAADAITPPNVAIIDEAIENTGLHLLEPPQYTRMSQQWYEFGGIYYSYPGYEAMALTAYANMGQRFAQNVEENNTLTIDCSAGGIDPRRSRSLRGALQSDFDVRTWETDLNAVPVLARPNLAVETVLDATDDAATGRAESNNAIAVLLAQAQHLIRASHRSNRLSFNVRFNPFINRTHTITFDAAGVLAKGKVYRYAHTIDPQARPGTLGAYTTVTLAISRPTLAVPSPTALVAPTPPAAPAIESGLAASYITLDLGNHIGGKATSPAWNDETMFGYIVNIPSGSRVDGMITNWGYAGMVASGVVSGGELSAATNPYRTQSTSSGVEYVSGEVVNPSYVAANAYPMGFRIPIPAVEDAARDNLNTQVDANYYVAIPSDLFTLIAP
jgi:hypothetical protein